MLEHQEKSQHEHAKKNTEVLNLFPGFKRAVELGLVDELPQNIEMIKGRKRGDYNPLDGKIRIGLHPSMEKMSARVLLKYNIPFRNEMIAAKADEFHRLSIKRGEVSNYEKKCIEALRLLREIPPDEFDQFTQQGGYNDTAVRELISMMSGYLSKKDEHTHSESIQEAIDQMSDEDFIEWFTSFWNYDVQSTIRHEAKHAEYFQEAHRTGLFTQEQIVAVEESLRKMPLVLPGRYFDLANVIYDPEHVEIEGQMVKHLRNHDYRKGEYFAEEISLFGYSNLERVRRQTGDIYKAHGEDAARNYVKYLYFSGIQELAILLKEYQAYPNEDSKMAINKLCKVYAQKSRYLLPDASICLEALERIDRFGNPDLSDLVDYLEEQMTEDGLNKMAQKVLTLVKSHNDDFDFNFHPDIYLSLETYKTGYLAGVNKKLEDVKDFYQGIGWEGDSWR